MKSETNITIPLKQGLTVEFNQDTLRIKGPKGEVARRVKDAVVKIKAEGQEIKIVCKKTTKRELSRINSIVAHIKNMVSGVQEPYLYRLKICSGHFPMNVAVTGNKFSIKNFLGEKVPREASLHAGVNVKVAGQEIIIESSDLELAGRTASDIERLTRISGRDRRVFQDGIFMTEKPQKRQEALSQ